MLYYIKESDGKDISSPGATCQVFYNHNDQWQKEERLKQSPSAVPQMLVMILKVRIFFCYIISFVPIFYRNKFNIIFLM